MAQLQQESSVATPIFLIGLGPRLWLRAVACAFLVAVVIGIPTQLIANSIFDRMLPIRTVDYVFLGIASILIGLILALSSVAKADGYASSIAGGLSTFLAVGCATCNKLVVVLLGTGGATSFFAPLQPLLGALTVVLLGIALHRMARSVQRAGACP